VKQTISIVHTAFRRGTLVNCFFLDTA